MDSTKIKLSIGLDPLLCSLVQEGLNVLRRASCADKSALDRIEQTLQEILLKENFMSQELDALIAEVARNTSVEKPGRAAIRGLAGKWSQGPKQHVVRRNLQPDPPANDDELAA